MTVQALLERLDQVIAKLTNRHEHNLLRQAQRLGAEHAARELPREIGDDLSLYVQPIDASYHEMGSNLHEEVPALSVPAEALAEKAHVDDTTKIREEQIAVLDEELRKQRIDHDRIELQFPWHTYLHVKIARFIIVLGEAVYNAWAFLILRGPALAAYILSISLAMASIWYAKFIPDFIRRGPTPRARRRRMWLLIGFTCALYLTLGCLRLAWVRKITNDPTSTPWLLDPAPWIFLLLNLFLLATLVVIEMRFSPSTEERVKKEQKETLQAQIDQTEEQIAQLKRDIDRDNKSRHEFWKASHRLLIRVKAMEQRIKDWHEQAIAAYMRENLLKRRDGRMPDCFRRNLKEVKGKLDDINM